MADASRPTALFQAISIGCVEWSSPKTSVSDFNWVNRSRNVRFHGPGTSRAGIRAATRAGSVRAAFHLYTTPDDVDSALNALTA